MRAGEFRTRLGGSFDCADWRGMMTLRPAGSGSPGTAARIPAMRNARGPDSAEPLSVMVPPTASPSSRASASETMATSPPASGSGDPPESGRSWRAGSAAGSTPTTVTGAGVPNAAVAVARVANQTSPLPLTRSVVK